MESSQFETLILAMQGLKVDLKAEMVARDLKLSAKIDALDHKLTARIDGLDQKLSGRIDGLDRKFGSLSQDVRAVREQTATTVVDAADLKVRVAKIEQVHPELL